MRMLGKMDVFTKINFQVLDRGTKFLLSFFGISNTVLSGMLIPCRRHGELPSGKREISNFW